MNGANSNTSGTTTYKLRFKPAGEGSLIAKQVRDEMERDGFVVIEAVAEGNVVVSPIEPTDKTKVWWKSDINGVPQGSPLIYNTASGKWEPINSDFVQYTPPAEKTGKVNIAAGAGPTPATVNFAPFNDADYSLSFYWKLPDGVAEPGTMPTNNGHFVTEQTKDGFKVTCFGIPTGGMDLCWKAVENVAQ